MVPNEMCPADARPHLKRFSSEKPADIYVAVGTERGLMGATMAHAQGLLLVDVDPRVARANAINVALLQEAKNREHYLRLRLDTAQWPSPTESPADDRNSPYREFLLNKDCRAFWNERVASGKGWQVFHNRENAMSGSDKPFGGGVNYLYCDAAFEHIKRLADAGKIQVAEGLDIFDARSAAALGNAIKASGCRVSVFDISNAWWPLYCKFPARLAAGIDAMGRVAGPNAILLATDRRNPRNCYGWSYHSFPLRRNQGQSLAARLHAGKFK